VLAARCVFETVAALLLAPALAITAWTWAWSTRRQVRHLL
jgi:hypothetical protein